MSSTAWKPAGRCRPDSGCGPTPKKPTRANVIWARLREAIPYLPHIQNTSCFWGVRTILRDLYDWDQPITADNWEKLGAMVRERAAFWSRCETELMS